MRVIAPKHWGDFCLQHPAAAQPLKAWAEEARIASWKTPQDIRQRYATASFLRGNRVVFSIKGNDYRPPPSPWPGHPRRRAGGQALNLEP